jgi:hypothetical protein
VSCSPSTDRLRQGSRSDRPALRETAGRWRPRSGQDPRS